MRVVLGSGCGSAGRLQWDRVRAGDLHVALLRCSLHVITEHVLLLLRAIEQRRAVPVVCRPALLSRLCQEPHKTAQQSALVGVAYGCPKGLVDSTTARPEVDKRSVCPHNTLQPS